MSWLNNSLSTLKGQITSFAQEVLAEDGSPENENPFQALEESQRKNEELSLLCSSKDTEIAALRRQITELQAKCGESGRSSKSSLEKNASLEDSWCWEPENIPSDSSVKNDPEGNSESSSGGEMIPIPLDAGVCEIGSYEKLPKNPEERDQRVKKLLHENVVLHEKVAQLTANNQLLNANIEELDSQHNDAINGLLDVKNQLQEKLNDVTKELKELQNTRETEFKKLKKETAELQNSLDKLRKSYDVCTEDNKHLQKTVETLRDCLAKEQAENVAVKTNLELKEKQLVELIEKVENWEGQAQPDEDAIVKLQAENASLKGIMDELGLDFEKLKDRKDLKNICIKKQNVEDGFVVLSSDDEDSESVGNLKKKCSKALSQKEKSESACKELETEIASLKAQIDLLSKENKNHLDRIQTLQGIMLEKPPSDDERDLQLTVSMLEKENTTLKEIVQNLQDRIATFENQIRISPTKHNELQSKCDELNKNLEIVNNNFAKYRDEQTYTHSALESQIAMLQDELRQAGPLVRDGDDLELKVVILEKEKSVLEAQVQIDAKRIDDLKKSMPIDPEEFQNLKERCEQYSMQFQCDNYEFMEYQEDQAEVRKEFQSKIDNLNKQVLSLQMQIQDGNESKEIEADRGNLQEELDRLTILNDRYKSDIEKLKQKIENCEANASDVESKLMMENVDLQKRLIDMESSLNENQTKGQVTSEDSSYSFEELKELFTTYIKTDYPITDKDGIESSLKSLRDKIWKIEILEKNLKQMSDEISRLVGEKSTIEHEKKTLQADVVNYEIECGELMKNNEILLNELENYKRNKLETIHENNEDSIIILEKQLEDCNNLNRTLEDEYKEMNQRIDDMENEKREYIIKLQTLQDTNAEINMTIKQLKTDLEILESEKCNLIFEINEMKTDDKKSAIDAEIQEYKGNIKELEGQLEHLSKDHADLVAAMQAQKASMLEYKRETDATITLLENKLKEKDIRFTEKVTEIEALQVKVQDNVELQKQYDSLKAEYEITVSEKEGLKKVVQDTNLKQDVVPGCEDCLKLKNDLETISKEKSELVQAVTTKHNENLQYYMEIQRLAQLYQAEVEKSNQQMNNCEKCAKLQEELKMISSTNAKEIEKLQDQINFLMEKSNILTTNLLTEQTNQKLLQQEKAELNEQNNNLRKDLERLRQHLVEQEEAHTQETLEMQNMVEETNRKMRELEDEVSKSSNAYTSASIRANQHAETLQAQYQLLSQQRDELATKLSTFEDRESKNQAALVNLQCALEQFQNEKEKDILAATQRIRNELIAEQEKQSQLQNEIATLSQQLVDANQGLLAAARLSDQLENSQVTITTLKEEIANLQSKNQVLDGALKTTEASQADKIEKSLVKSLIIGYIVSNNPNDKNQILKMITTVLGFDQAETDKIGLNKSHTGWLGGLLHVGSTVTHSTDSLARAFVNFLEEESRPRNDTSGMPNLLNIVSEGPSSSATDAKSNERKLSEPKSHQSAIQPILLDENVLGQFPPTRNSSSILKDILSDS